jgi:hypothetical protein
MKACYFCIENKTKLVNDMEDSIDLYWKHPTLTNMVKSARAGKLVQEYVLCPKERWV